MTYLAIINTPGYLSEQDEPPEFETAKEAWWYLYHERCDAERDYTNETGLCSVCGNPYTDDHDDDSETGQALAAMAKAEPCVPGVVVGNTVGEVLGHDIGLAYSVTIKEEEPIVRTEKRIVIYPDDDHSLTETLEEVTRLVGEGFNQGESPFWHIEYDRKQAQSALNVADWGES